MTTAVGKSILLFLHRLQGWQRSEPLLEDEEFLTDEGRSFEITTGSSMSRPNEDD
jgi:hypothetical protein